VSCLTNLSFEKLYLYQQFIIELAVILSLKMKNFYSRVELYIFIYFGDW